MRVLVCGGRDYNRAAVVYSALDDLLRLHGDVTVIEGGARGADALAAKWANDHNAERVAHLSYPANWERYGKRAGHIRNRQMLDEGRPDLVLAFPGGRGTADMVRQARERGIDVWSPAPQPEGSREP